MRAEDAEDAEDDVYLIATAVWCELTYRVAGYSAGGKFTKRDIPYEAEVRTIGLLKRRIARRLAERSEAAKSAARQPVAGGVR